MAEDVRYFANPEGQFVVRVRVPKNGTKIILEAQRDDGAWVLFMEKDGFAEGNIAEFKIHRGASSTGNDPLLRAFAEGATGTRSLVSFNQGVLDYTTPGSPEFVA